MVRGIRTTALSQIIFIDTPGIHQGHSLMNRRLMDTALHTLDDVDGVLWLLDAHDKIKQEEERIAETLRGVETPVLILLNKMDLVSKGKLLPLMERCAQLLPDKEILKQARLKHEIYYTSHKRDILAYHYTDNRSRIVVVVAGYDIDGWGRLKDLRDILLTCLFIGIAIAHIVTFCAKVYRYIIYPVVTDIVLHYIGFCKNGRFINRYVFII